MFQTYSATSSPDQGPPRLASLRAALARSGLSGFLVPRADVHQGEYVAPRDERLAWLTGFTGSAGFCAVLPKVAGVFIDGRYRVQVKAQVALDQFTPVPWPETKLEDWLAEQMPPGGVVGFDPWLHTSQEVDRLETALTPAQITLRPVANQIDAIWPEQPDRPDAPAMTYPAKLAGMTSGQKRADIAQALAKAGHTAAVLTLPDSICWLLNIRGSDLPHLPVVQTFAILDREGHVTLFSDPAKFDGLGPDPDITLKPWDDFETVLAGLSGPVRVDPATAPHKVRMVLDAAGIEVAPGEDPCILPKACKTPAEIAATTTAHIRDGAAFARFLHWFDETAPKGGLTEIDCARALEGFRAETGVLRDISFDTIAGAGANGAIVHYRVTEQTNATLTPGQLFLIDSGAQYEDGTTDITRTLPVGEPGDEEKTAFTQVLRGMIAVSRARFPKGIAGRDLDSLARAPLWSAGRDFDHGTGHGVGVYLSVHEGPQRISRASTLPLRPGMILSNEPGYYREGAFGIRIENLLVVTEAPSLPGGDDRDMLSFDTLTWAPVDRRLIDAEAMNRDEIGWLNDYHATIADKLRPHLPPDTAEWLARATAPL
ncbi:aminopeptidase P family protein [Nioella nitratireducens]|uniref:aminopeptidase P family protein n=1 Tax=Nioella nitratireducens TaxID=1287720 RepID=UPI0008FD7F48|nr:aminopeptidase P family protein [Nioella nitratireducens]